MKSRLRTSGVRARKRVVRSFYDPLAVCDLSSQRVGWDSRERHVLRLRAAIECLGDLRALGSVLDAGCGEGALLEVLGASGFRGRYRGEDLLPSMIERARRNFPEGEFAVADLFADGPEADAVVCLGALHTGVSETHAADVEKAIAALWRRTRRVLVVSVLHDLRFAATDLLVAVDLPRVFAAARALASATVVRDDVEPGEALFVLRRDRRETLARLLPEEDHVISRSQVHFEAGELVAAMDAIAGRRDAEATLQRGMIADGLGRHVDAERCFRSVLDDDVLGEVARFHLSMWLFRRGRTGDALEILLNLAMAPTVVGDEARFLCARMLRAHGHEESAKRYEELIADPWVANAVRARPREE